MTQKTKNVFMRNKIVERQIFFRTVSRPEVLFSCNKKNLACMPLSHRWKCAGVGSHTCSDSVCNVISRSTPPSRTESIVIQNKNLFPEATCDRPVFNYKNIILVVFFFFCYNETQLCPLTSYMFIFKSLIYECPYDSTRGYRFIFNFI